MLSSFKIGF